MRPIRLALGSTAIDPALLTHAERLQHEGYLRREEAYDLIRPWPRPARRSRRSCVGPVVAANWCAISCAAAVVTYSAAGRTPRAASRLARRRMVGGCRNGAELWRRLRASGFRGSLRVVAEWATRRRRAESAGCERLRKPPSARVLSRLLLSERDQLTKGDAITVARIERGVPALVSARDLVERFHRMVRDRDPTLCPLDHRCRRQRPRILRQRHCR